MRYEDVEIRGIGELINTLKQQTSNNGIIWFRGHADASWKLVPTVARHERLLVAENICINRFRQNARMHLVDGIPQDEWDWIFLMQHHRAPTRLLDWSESPLTALYFSVSDLTDEHNGKNGALWCLDPLALNKLAGIRTNDPLEIPYFGDQVLQNYLPDQVASRTHSLNPIAAIGPRNSKRMMAQLGVFTITHNEHTPIEEIGTKQHAWRIIIPSDAKHSFREELEYLGYNRLTIFPDLDSVAAITTRGLL